jgi:hypothetical protein
MEIYNPYDSFRRQEKPLERSNDAFQKHMDLYWKEKNKTEKNRFKLTIIIAIIGVIIAAISLLFLLAA